MMLSGGNGDGAAYKGGNGYPVTPWSGSLSSASSESPQTNSINLSVYWRLILKHRVLIAAVFVASVILGLIVTLLMTPVYTASTTLQIDREAARVLNVEDTQPREAMIQGEEFFQTQYGLLRSRSLADRVIDNLGLATSDTFIEAMGATAPTRGDARQQRAERRQIVDKLVRDNLAISPVRGSRLVSISFTSPDAALSTRVVNSFAENFIQSNLDRKFESSVYARRFLENLLTQTRARLEDAERQLVAYATEQEIINVADGDSPGESQSLASNSLVSLNTELSDATAERVAAESKWRQAGSSQIFSLPEVLQNPAIQRLREESAKLSAEYEQKTSVYRPEFPEMVRLRAQISELDRQIDTLAGGVRTSIRNDYQIALARENGLTVRVQGLKDDVLDLRGRSIQYNILQREVDTSRTLYDGLLQRYKEVGVTGGVTTNNISIVDTAPVPTKPSSPRLAINLLIAALIGSLLGAVVVFIFEALDESLTTPDDVEAKLSIPVLGIVPKLGKGVEPREALADTRSPFSEAYQSLRTSLSFSTANGPPRTLLVTSSRPSEGKSTTARAIAQTMAGVGKTVLLVDGDLRNPSMHRAMGTDNVAGMSNLLSGSEAIASLVARTPTQGLSFISSGPIPPNPAELWGSERVRRFLEEALSTYDHVVIDGPPVLGFADAPLLAAAVEGTAFVLESRGTKRGQARGALKRLKAGNARILGIVLTKFDAKAVSYGGYDYSYDYDYGARGGRSAPGK